MATTYTIDANVEARLSMEPTDSFARGSISSRGSFNKKNLSIDLPPDEPGTEINPAWKTPVIENNIKPAIKPAFNSSPAGAVGGVQ